MISLNGRWQIEPGLGFAKKLFTLGYSGNGFQVCEAPFGAMPQSGRLDLRNLSVAAWAQGSRASHDRPCLRRVSIKHADLSEADLSLTRLEGCEFDDVKFDRASLMDASDHGNQFRHCSFENTDLTDVILGYRGSKFHSCTFRRAKFRRSRFIRCEFTNCIFDFCALNSCDFNGSSFEDCGFLGPLKDVWFRGSFPLESHCEKYGTPRFNTMKSVSFEKATPRLLTFSDNCDLSTVILPNNDRYALFDRWPLRLEWVLEHVQSWPDNLKSQAESYIQIFQTHALKQNWYLLAIDDLISHLGEETASRLWRSLHDFN